MKRKQEIISLNSLSSSEIKAKTAEHLIVLKDNDELHQFFAEHMCNLIEKNNSRDEPTSLIVPFGPTGQYPIFINMVNTRRISLIDTQFFFMDEYADNEGFEISENHHLSFRGKLYTMFDTIDKELLPDFSKIIFPSHENLNQLKEMIAKRKLNCTYGGVGIHGHLAFNEPERGVRDSDPRVVHLNDFTVTINSIRASIGGDLENFPRKALTLGMNQLFSAEKMVIFCRNGIDSIDWANTVLRLALLGTPGDDYPVTYLKEHNDWVVVTDEDTLKTRNTLS